MDDFCGIYFMNNNALQAHYNSHDYNSTKMLKRKVESNCKRGNAACYEFSCCYASGDERRHQI